MDTDSAHSTFLTEADTKTLARCDIEENPTPIPQDYLNLLNVTNASHHNRIITYSKISDGIRISRNITKNTTELRQIYNGMRQILEEVSQLSYKQTLNLIESATKETPGFATKIVKTLAIIDTLDSLKITNKQRGKIVTFAHSKLINKPFPTWITYLFVTTGVMHLLWPQYKYNFESWTSAFWSTFGGKAFAIGMSIHGPHRIYQYTKERLSINVHEVVLEQVLKTGLFINQKTTSRKKLLKTTRRQIEQKITNNPLELIIKILLPAKNKTKKHQKTTVAEIARPETGETNSLIDNFQETQRNSILINKQISITKSKNHGKFWQRIFRRKDESQQVSLREYSEA